MRLYHVPHTRSTRVLWLLEEIGEPYDLTIITREDQRSPEHLARHPLGRVPVAEEDGRYLYESSAIVFHLADLHPEAGLVAPPGSWERAKQYQWAFFAMVEIEGAVVDYSAAKEADAARADSARKAVRAACAVVEDALEGREYLVGDSFSVADVVTGGVVGYARFLGLTDGLPNVAAYLDRLDARPARQRAQAIH